jgi:hypothetical protein
VVNKLLDILLFWFYVMGEVEKALVFLALPFFVES